MPGRQGTKVGGYVLEELIAKGSFGAVYRATHVTNGSPAAIKLLHDQFAARPDILSRFEREIEIIQRLQHPNVVRILDNGRDVLGAPYMAMELLEGMTLAAYMRIGGRVSPSEALDLLEPIANALDAAHALGVIHRDLKGSNVFLADKKKRVVLLDFGVAKLLDLEGPALTKSRELIGTLACMSPEQISSQPVDARTDVYGLGVLAFQLLVGELPFQSRLFPVMCELHLHAPPPTPSSRAPLHPAFDAVIVKALSKSPSDRFPRPGAFIEALRAVAYSTQRSPSKPSITQQAVVVYGECDAEGMMSSVGADLSAVGLTLMVETPVSVMLSALLPEDADSAAVVRRGVATAALAAYARIRASNNRSNLRLFCHVGEVLVSPDGRTMDGSLLDLSSWVPEEAIDGVFASAEIINGLSITHHATVGDSGANLRISVLSAT